VNDIDIILDQLSNDDTSSDNEMVKFLTKETNVGKRTLENIIKKERPLFLKSPMVRDGAQRIKKYLIGGSLGLILEAIGKAKAKPRKDDKEFAAIKKILKAKGIKDEVKFSDAEYQKARNDIYKYLPKK